jgi:hypothetical protein
MNPISIPHLREASKFLLSYVVIYSILFKCNYNYYTHDMASSQVAYTRDCLQTEGSYEYNERQRRGGPPASVFGEGVEFPHRKEQACCKVLHVVSVLSFGNETLTQSLNLLN